LSKSIPYWRLSGYYFFYFAFVGAMSPYWGPYLKSLGFDAVEIGVLMSLLAVMRIFAPNIWGWMADRSGKRIPSCRSRRCRAWFASPACFSIKASGGCSW